MFFLSECFVFALSIVCIQYLILDGSKRVNNKQHMSKLINAQITSVEVLLQSSSYDNINLSRVRVPKFTTKIIRYYILCWKCQNKNKTMGDRALLKLGGKIFGFTHALKKTMTPKIIDVFYLQNGLLHINLSH